MKLNAWFIGAALVLTACSKPDPTACECHDGIKKNGKEYENFDRCEALKANAEFMEAFKECSRQDILIGNTKVQKVDDDLLSKQILGSFNLKTDASSISWKGEKVTGKNHTGTLALKSGEVSFSEGKFVSGKVVVDMNSIEVTDEMPEKPKSKLTGHLQSADFFDAENHPTATFETVSIEETGQNAYYVKGKLTIKGITQDADCVMIFVNKENGDIVGGGTMSFDRSKFDVRYGSGTFFENLGDDLIKDQIDLKLQLQFAPAGA